MKRYLVVALLFLLSGCSAREIYESGRVLQQYQCSQIQDYHERKRCMEGEQTSYEQYQDDLESLNEKP